METTSRMFYVPVAGTVDQSSATSIIFNPFSCRVTPANAQHVVPVEVQVIWAVVLLIQVSITLLSQQMAAEVQVIVVLKKALGHYFLWNLWEALLEVLQYVIV